MTVLNHLRAQCLIATAYAKASLAEAAVRHAEKCLALGAAAGERQAPFDRAMAHGVRVGRPRGGAKDRGRAPGTRVSRPSIAGPERPVGRGAGPAPLPRAAAVTRKRGRPATPKRDSCRLTVQRLTTTPQPMMRRLLGLLMFVSLLLSIAACAAWVRSYFVQDALAYAAKFIAKCDNALRDML